MIRLGRLAIDLNVPTSRIIEALEERGWKIKHSPRSTIEKNQELYLRKIFGAAYQQQQHDETNRKLKKVKPVELKDLSQLSKLVRIGAKKQKRSSKKNRKKNIGEWIVGKVKFFNDDKGFGFVTAFSDHEDSFIHISVLHTPVNEDDIVAYGRIKSTRKEGRTDAIDVYQITEFKESDQLLVEFFFSPESEIVRFDLLKKLPIESQLVIFRRVLKAYPQPLSAQNFGYSFQYLSLILEGKEDTAEIAKVREVYFGWINELQDEDISTRLWLTGESPFEVKAGRIREFFLRANQDDRLRVLFFIADEFRLPLISAAFDLNEPVKSLILARDFLYASINESKDKPQPFPLYDVIAWSDVPAFSVYQGAVALVRAQISQKQEAKLFFDGYFNNVSLEYLTANNEDLNPSQIDTVIRRLELGEKERKSFLRDILESDIRKIDQSPPNSPEYVHISKRLTERLQRRHDNIKGFREVFDEILTDLPVQIKRKFWFSRILPTITFADQLLILEQAKTPFTEIDLWEEKSLINGEQKIILSERIFVQLKNIRHRKDYYRLVEMIGLSPTVDSWLDSDKTPNVFREFAGLARWISGGESTFSFKNFKRKFVYLSPKDQIIFLRKLFWRHDTGLEFLTIEMLDSLLVLDKDVYELNLKYHPEKVLDISAYVVIEIIKEYKSSGAFILDSGLINIVVRNLAGNPKQRFSLGQLFEKCLGRMVLELDKHAGGKKIAKFWFDAKDGGKDYYLTVKSPDLNAQSTGEIDAFPGKVWNPERNHWGVHRKYESLVKSFGQKNGYYLELGGTQKDNIHLVKEKRGGVPTGRPYCDGQLSDKPDHKYGKNFWWCANLPCFQDCSTNHTSQEWGKYTMLDFLRILGLQHSTGKWAKNSYKNFISLVNRFTTLLDRMYCDECDEILRPVKKSLFAYHRVTKFCCVNGSCSKHNEEIYLNHCFNGRCNYIIDSRVSKRCSNGLVICSNPKCGRCCSHKTFEQRLDSLVRTSNWIPPDLEETVKWKLGHFERGEYECYKCGNEMKETYGKKFECVNCDNVYDLRQGKLSWPHKGFPKNQAEKDAAERKNNVG